MVRHMLGTGGTGHRWLWGGPVWAVCAEGSACACFQFTRTTSTDDAADAVAETVQSLVQPHLATLAIWTQDILLQSF